MRESVIQRDAVPPEKPPVATDEGGASDESLKRRRGRGAWFLPIRIAGSHIGRHRFGRWDPSADLFKD